MLVFTRVSSSFQLNQIIGMFFFAERCHFSSSFDLSPIYLVDRQDNMEGGYLGRFDCSGQLVSQNSEQYMKRVEDE